MILESIEDTNARHKREGLPIGNSSFYNETVVSSILSPLGENIIAPLLR
jgi:hypothetical protein